MLLPSLSRGEVSKKRLQRKGEKEEEGRMKELYERRDGRFGKVGLLSIFLLLKSFFLFLSVCFCSQKPSQMNVFICR